VVVNRDYHGPVYELAVSGSGVIAVVRLRQPVGEREQHRAMGRNHLVRHGTGLTGPCTPLRRAARMSMQEVLSPRRWDERKQHRQVEWTTGRRWERSSRTVLTIAVNGTDVYAVVKR